MIIHKSFLANLPKYIARTENNMSYSIWTPLCEAIQLETKSIWAFLSVAIKSIYNTPKTWIAKTPKTDNKTILKKSVLTFKSVPEKNIAGIKARIYPNPYSNK